MALRSAVTSAIIPAAGLGTRLYPITAGVPKELLPLGPKPALQWIAEELANAGLTKLVLISSVAKPVIDRLFHVRSAVQRARLPSSGGAGQPMLWSEGPYANTQIELALQPEQLGLGHAVLCGKQNVGGQAFVVALGDCVFGPPGQNNIVGELIRVFVDQTADAVIAFESAPLEKVSRYGIADPAEDAKIFHLKDIVEKPTVDAAPSRLAVAARYVFSPKIFEHLESQGKGVGGEIQLTDAIREMIRRGNRVLGVRIDDELQRFDLGDYASYVRSFKQFAEWFPPTDDNQAGN